MRKYPQLLKAVIAYIQKADEDLEKKLKNEGYIEPKETVADINSVDDDLSEVLETEKNLFIDGISEETDIEVILDEVLPTLALSDTTDEEIQKLFFVFFEDFIKSKANTYMQSIDNEMAFNIFCDRTTDWITEWSQDLGKLMKLNSHNKIQSVLSNGLENGESIDKIVNKLIDAYEFSPMRARRTAITEVLTAHSYAKQEALIQSPVVEKKEWRHTGNHKNTPRPHHQAMDGQVVDKNEKFIINSPTGVYECNFPRDTSLPASERVNCHCTHRAVIKDDIFGLSVEERKELQQQAIEDNNGEWEKELKAKNKAKADINEEVIKYDWIRAKSKEEQIKYLGSVKGKWALLESGVIKNDKDLKKMFKTVKVNSNGKEVSRDVVKTIDELRDDGIIVIRHTPIRHSYEGEFKPSSKEYPNGRLYTGGHSKTSKDLCDDKEIAYEIKGTFSNGVSVGNVPSAKIKAKKVYSGQAWFPDDWSEDDILVAGTFVANSSVASNDYHKTDVWNDVAVRILFDEEGEITTVCPDLDQHLYVKGVDKI
ncbi:phage minor head protein [Anaerovorax sp. IOR16]|uniref:phage minor head protein n=1 Tax=Anaerovorax sp. IOR16 TaxID=2773458 RepID=UPI0019D2C865|nr:phage minor head protein [Anaerovorax sp. IOR16]